ncbi:hypothetical protein BDF22DRAFT_740460 [Syncephalis plumigaleata]|nr:hypothetical protein BDF22DRAFT_740460 [Syncephalis plumigaleata]
MPKFTGTARLCFTQLDPQWSSSNSSNSSSTLDASPSYLDAEWFQGHALLKEEEDNTLVQSNTIFTLAGWPAQNAPPIHACCRASSGEHEHEDKPATPDASQPYYDLRLENQQTGQVLTILNVLRPSSSDTVRLCMDDATTIATTLEPSSSESSESTEMNIVHYEFNTTRLLVDEEALAYAKRYYPRLAVDTQLRICRGEFILHYTPQSTDQ